MSKISKIGREILAGLGRLASIWPATQVKGYPHATELDALRGDTVQIGDDMRKVLDGYDHTAKRVEGPVNMADLRRKVMARHPVVRATLAKK